MDKQTTYQNLRNEMMFLMQRQDTYNLFAYTIAGTLWSIAFSQKISWLALIPMLISLLISLRIYESRFAIEKLSAYMQECLEDKTITDWEYMNSRHYGKFGSQKSKVYRLSKYTFTIIGAISSIIFWIINKSVKINGSIWFGVFIIIPQIAFVVFQTKIISKNNNTWGYKDSLKGQWKVLRDELNAEHKEK